MERLGFAHYKFDSIYLLTPTVSFFYVDGINFTIKLIIFKPSNKLGFFNEKLIFNLKNGELKDCYLYSIYPGNVINVKIEIKNFKLNIYSDLYDELINITLPTPEARFGFITLNIITIPKNFFGKSKIFLTYNNIKNPKEFNFYCCNKSELTVKKIFPKFASINTNFIIHGYNFNANSVVYLLSEDKTCLIQQNIIYLSFTKIKVIFDIKNFENLENFDKNFYNKKFFVYIINRNNFSKLNKKAFIIFNK